MAYRYYLGPWVWGTRPQPGWCAPPGTRGLVDLASLPQQGATTGSLRPVGFFACEGVLGSEYVFLGDGDCREMQADARTRDAWQSATGYRPEGERLVDLLWDQLTVGSDPEGQGGVRPIMPGTDGWVDLRLGGHSRVKAERFEWGRPGSRGHDHTPKVRAVLQGDFRRIWDDAQKPGRDRDHPRRVLDFWCDEHRISDWQEFVPADLRRHVPGRLPHQTTITESWPTNGTTISSGQDLTWSETNGDVTVVSGEARNSGSLTICEARAQHDLSSANQAVQAVIASMTVGSLCAWALCARFASGARTYYDNEVYNFAVATDEAYLLKVVAGARTTLAGPSNPTLATGETWKLEVSGSNLTSYQNGVSRVAVTDSAVTGNLRTGIWLYGEGGGVAGLDLFEASDLGGGAPAILYTQLERGVRGLVRGTWGGYA